MTILAGKGDGTFQELSYVYAGYPSAPIRPYAIAADFNGDGIPDLAVSLTSGAAGSNTVTIFIGKGDGSFQQPFNCPLNIASPWAIIAGDFNGDGWQDVATAAGSVASFFFGNGDGTFQPTPVSYPVPGWDNALAAGGFSGDGRTGIVVSVGNRTDALAILTGARGALAGTGGTPQSTIAGLPFAASLQFTVKDPAGQPVSGILVSFSVKAGSSGAAATLSSATAITDASGTASVTATANHTLGSFTVTATAGSLSATYSLTNIMGPPAILTAAFGTPQYTRAGTAFPMPLEALVTDAGGNPLSGVTVTFSAPASGASANLSSSTAVTNANGNASVTATANGALGGYRVTASAEGLTAEFTLGNQAPSSICLSASPNPSAFGAPVTLTAAVAPAAATGKVAFYDGAPQLGVAALSSGAASVTTALLPAGSRSLKAIYTGDPNYAIASSAVVPQSVNAAGGNVLRLADSPAVSAGPSSVVIGDFNGDGKADLVTTAANTHAVNILLGTGGGAFQPATTCNAGYYPRFVAVADFDGDGKQDLAMTTLSPSALSILLGNGDGSFKAAVNYPAGSGARSITVGDFNGDGKADLAVANEYDHNVSVLLGNGDGTFQKAVNYATGSGNPASTPVSIVAGDFNGDGKIDLATANSNAGTVSVLSGNGDGTYQAPVYRSLFVSGQIVAADFNGDGTLDPAAIESFGVAMLLGNGDGTFKPGLACSLGSATIEPAALAVTDFNGDGKPDLAVAAKDPDPLASAGLLLVLWEPEMARSGSV